MFWGCRLHPFNKPGLPHPQQPLQDRWVEVGNLAAARRVVLQNVAVVTHPIQLYESLDVQVRKVCVCVDRQYKEESLRVTSFS